ncbi:competence protein CoiA family protein [Methylorubrum extorquens]|jgi:hypothetical protein|uniref:competence protein CoiA family protein n=1 Tax=Methylorubrum extorquens TaxID=408 RepID=UPI002FEDE9C7
MQAGVTAHHPPESLLFGERADGTIAHISDVPSGIACGCRCPSCHRPLVARKGDQMVHHFAHHGAGDEHACQSGPETALHRFAKELLASRLALVLPPLQILGETQLSMREPYRFDAAVLERRMGAIIPDVILRRANRDLMVEFCVAHACPANKIAKIEQLGIAAVEIDLSELAHRASRQELEDAILIQSPRRWLHNPKIARAPSGELQPAPARFVTRVDPSIAALQRAYLSACREVQTMRVRSLGPSRIAADGLAHAIRVEVAGLGCFTVGPADWQAAILVSALDRALAGRSGLVSTKAALQQLRERDQLRTRFSRLSAAEAAALRSALPTFALPKAAIADWAMALSRQGILVPSSARDQWVIRRETLQLVREARQRHAGSVKVAASAPEPFKSRGRF